MGRGKIMMNINITEIVNDKIEKLKEEGVIEKAITDTFEKSIVYSSLNLYIIFSPR